MTSSRRCPPPPPGKAARAPSPKGFAVRRVYDPPQEEDGLRVLVDRLWPRGLSKDAARVDLWLKDIAPSDALRKWYGHDPARWDEFRRRYFSELEVHRERLEELKERARRGRVTLLFGARDEERNNAVALRQYLESGRR
jgi:uncharacterized protein YeaO (DUF488 family)